MQRHLRAHCQEINVNAQEHTGVATAMGNITMLVLVVRLVLNKKGATLLANFELGHGRAVPEEEHPQLAAVWMITSFYSQNFHD